ncbi:flagellar motor protein MotB [Psychromonas sp. Urea-02u-13]|uniref:flagellar motor protein MotB n=1 Tax=Psychromonas sp. Urea-02u-13 TaxID=2058326 RepID=UPI000C34A533|nr:flagellar motor protein MotB [Psychromonas sp. Urea-02u-13]PKG37582.1 flagellar motor protein MotB [Psychromonas sp. Urea-02u-13]
MAEEECKCPPEGLPAWMGTFADLMSLLMCFFVLLLSFSEMDVLKFKQIAGSMRNAFGVQSMLEVKDIPKGTSVIAQEFTPGKPDPTPIEVVMQQTIEVTKAKLDFQDGDSSRVGGQENVKERKVASPQESEAESASEAPTQEKQSESEESQLEDFNPAPGVSAQHGLAKKVAKELREEIEDGAIEIEALGQQLIIRVREKGAFPSGSAFLQPRFRPVIRKVATILVDVPGVITISGHTDNEQIQSELYRSNWDLSAQRAVSVAHEMLNVRGIRNKKLVVVGYANSKPLEDSNSKPDKRRNRRVEIMIMQGEAAESEEIGVSEK